MQEPIATPTGTYDTITTPSTPSAGQGEPTVAELQARIAQMEAQMKVNAVKNRQEVVEGEDGTRKTIAEIQKETRVHVDEANFLVAQVKRENEEYAARNPVPFLSPDGRMEYRPSGHVDKVMFPTAEDAEKYIGRTAWVAMDSQQRAQVRTIRASDVERLNPSDFFGRSSSSQKSMRLMRESPGLYRLLKARAIEEDVF